MYMVHRGIVSGFLILLMDRIGCDKLWVRLSGIIVERFFAGLLERKVGAVGHLLGLVVLLGGQALDQLVVFLYLLLVVLHRL